MGVFRKKMGCRPSGAIPARDEPSQQEKESSRKFLFDMSSEKEGANLRVAE